MVLSFRLGEIEPFLSVDVFKLITLLKPEHTVQMLYPLQSVSALKKLQNSTYL